MCFDKLPGVAIIMTSKAKKLRRMGNGLEVVYAEQEREQKSPREMFKVSMTRPYVFLFTEPITYLAAAINGWVATRSLPLFPRCLSTWFETDLR